MKYGKLKSTIANTVISSSNNYSAYGIILNQRVERVFAGAAISNKVKTIQTGKTVEASSVEFERV